MVLVSPNVPVKSKLQHPPPGQPPPPGHLKFWKIFVQIPPSLGRKAVQIPPPRGKLPDYCFNFSAASIHLIHKWPPTWYARAAKHGIESFWDNISRSSKETRETYVCSPFGKRYSRFLFKWRKSIIAKKRRVTFLA